MAKAVHRRRKYDSTRRLAQAADTRERVLRAAHRLFTERGYSGTTMQAIADEAGIAFQTVYSNFKNKRRVLVTLFNVSSAPPGEEGTPIPARARTQAMAREPDQRRQLQIFAQVVADNLTGAAPISEIIVDAARTEPDIQKILERLNAGRLEHMALAVKQIAAHGPLRAGLDATSARDIVWILASPEVFLLLKRDRGWSKDKYAAWLADMLMKALLP
jgi:AcrR family transcriptional regulator